MDQHTPTNALTVQKAGTKEPASSQKRNEKDSQGMRKVVQPIQEGQQESLTENTPDAELVAQLRAGTSSAADFLYQRYYSPLCAYLSRILSDKETGHDLAHDAFVCAFAKPPSLQGDQCFRKWIFRIGTNLAKDFWRRSKSMRSVYWTDLSEGQVERLCIESPEQQIEDKDLVLKAFAHVSEKFRPCLYFDIIEKMPQKDIAIMLKMNPRTVRRYIRLGKDELLKVRHLFTEE